MILCSRLCALCVLYDNTFKSTVLTIYTRKKKIILLAAVGRHHYMISILGDTLNNNKKLLYFLPLLFSF